MFKVACASPLAFVAHEVLQFLVGSDCCCDVFIIMFLCTEGFFAQALG